MSKQSDNSSTPSGDQLTTTAGKPVADNQNSLSAGPRGPLLLQDYQLLEKLAQQNRERIPNAPCTQRAGVHTARSRSTPISLIGPLSGLVEGILALRDDPLEPERPHGFDDLSGSAGKLRHQTHCTIPRHDLR
jgi:hypothetical protein